MQYDSTTGKEIEYSAADLVRIAGRVRKIAKDRPHVIYCPNDPTHGCYYNRGECTDGSIGCIIGQAIADLGLPRYDGEAAIWHLLSEDARNQPACDWLMTLQGMQDARKTWANAVKVADCKHKRIPTTTIPKK